MFLSAVACCVKSKRFRLAKSVFAVYVSIMHPSTYPYLTTNNYCQTISLTGDISPAQIKFVANTFGTAAQIISVTSQMGVAVNEMVVFDTQAGLALATYNKNSNTYTGETAMTGCDQCVYLGGRFRFSSQDTTTNYIVDTLDCSIYGNVGAREGLTGPMANNYLAWVDYCRFCSAPTISGGGVNVFHHPPYKSRPMTVDITGTSPSLPEATLIVDNSKSATSASLVTFCGHFLKNVPEVYFDMSSTSVVTQGNLVSGNLVFEYNEPTFRPSNRMPGVFPPYPPTYPYPPDPT